MTLREQALSIINESSGSYKLTKDIELAEKDVCDYISKLKMAKDYNISIAPTCGEHLRHPGKYDGYLMCRTAPIGQFEIYKEPRNRFYRDILTAIDNDVKKYSRQFFEKIKR